ncbi:hypothetical protein J2857_005234 [Neorhizobium galegae]|uniref:ATPase inhibitor subunit zeta n=1 Tax=Neorhizobium galegae TaxID=399 RepID=UPI001AE9F72B|nr:ATPase inhibitor subunit zeta [Neorhizobium galegae]MBP2562443.1 hypothetical protein [Neorhizobium galegae]
MTADQARRRALEERYILDFQMLFKTRTRRDLLFATWAATKLGRQDPADYLEEVRSAGRAAPGDDDILQKVLADFRSVGQEITEEDLRSVMNEMMFDAAEELEADRISRQPRQSKS